MPYASLRTVIAAYFDQFANLIRFKALCTKLSGMRTRPSGEYSCGRKFSHCATYAWLETEGLDYMMRLQQEPDAGGNGLVHDCTIGSLNAIHSITMTSRNNLQLDSFVSQALVLFKA